MGYNIGIGELEVTYEQEESYINLRAKRITDKKAPNFGFGDISEDENYRY